MKTTGRISGAVIIFFLMGIASLPILSGQLVPEAQAFRGRGAAFVVGAAVGSASSSSAEASAAASQQQAAAAQQQAAMSQQQAAAAQQQAEAEAANSRRPSRGKGPRQPSGRRQQPSSRPLPPSRPEKRCRWGPSFPPFPEDVFPPRRAG